MSLQSLTIGFVGAGNMAEAIFRGLLKANAVPAQQIVASDRHPDRLSSLAESYGLRTTTSNIDAVKDAHVVVLAVKPQILTRVMEEIGEHIRPGTLVISVAAGYTMAQLRENLPESVSVCRSMPNMPALVGAGATAYVFGGKVSEAQRGQAAEIFSAIGLGIEVMEETLLDAVTGLSGSGPAYVFMIIEALSDAGVKVGLSRRQAQQLSAQTVLGSAHLLLESGEHPGVLKDKVTSPGGTAIAGLHTLEDGGLRTTLINAVGSATARCKELAEIAEKALRKD
ncbi:MAG: pyrroline-5-carboxylate reductase [Myxococcota bacterium]|nr:pyrroline-5-carboxylate reductase [Myxococcota bacterium]